MGMHSYFIFQNIVGQISIISKTAKKNFNLKLEKNFHCKFEDSLRLLKV